MFKFVRRVGRYTSAALRGKFDEIADPKVQLTQAIEEAQEQHRKLKQQAARVIANQKQTELRLNRKIAELEKTTGSARHAVLLADEAQKAGDNEKVLNYTRVAEALASKMIGLEADVESLKELHYQTTQAADQSKAAVEQNSMALQHKLAERQKLLSQLDQAKMQEQVNAAMQSLSESVGQDVPTLDQVRDKIEARYARALGAAEVVDQNMELKMLELERLAMDAEAQVRLSKLRSQLGITSGAKAKAELEQGRSTDEDLSVKHPAPAEVEEPPADR